ncbi:hypothetical protein AB0J86_27830 [Micromonospora sp. NPDC049559]|uniref:hypothetical protein n=1 Tax=Micromonospora sp. NPDC049559 TaxID=3155923 RepID=UPI0034334627
MSPDLDEHLVATLRHRAERDIDADALLRGSLRRAAHRRRRRLVTAVGTAGLVSLVLVTAAVTVANLGAPEPPPADRTSISPSPTPSLRTALPRRPGSVREPAVGDHRLPTLPGPGGPSVLARPDLVATDPSVVHFSAGRIPLLVQEAGWVVQPGVAERISLGLLSRAGNAASFSVALTRGQGQEELPPESASAPGDLPPVTRTVQLAGRPATLTTLESADGRFQHWLRWSPADGLTMLATADQLSEGEVVEIADVIDFGQTSRCASPVRLTAVPPGAYLTACSMRVSLDRSRPYVNVALEVGDVLVNVTAGDSSPPPPAGWSTPPRVLGIPDLAGCAVTLNVTGPAPDPQARGQVVADGFRREGDCRRPETWPVGPPVPPSALRR